MGKGEVKEKLRKENSRGDGAEKGREAWAEKEWRRRDWGVREKKRDTEGE